MSGGRYGLRLTWIKTLFTMVTWVSVVSILLFLIIYRRTLTVITGKTLTGAVAREYSPISIGGNNSYDGTTIASHVTSTVDILDNLTIYSVGDKVKVRITLYDQLGRRKTTGGDILRLWLKEDKVKANVAGEVIDNQDGSYTGSVLLPWRGRPTIRVSIAVPQEMHALILNIIKRNNGSYFRSLGMFVNGNVKSEMTHCGPFFPMGDKADLCNYSDNKQGFEWYCVAPKTAGLSCMDWSKIQIDQSLYGISKSEQRFLRVYHDRNLKASLTFTVGKGDVVMTTGAVPCDRRPREDTWNTRPSGFYFENVWIPNGCKQTNLPDTNSSFKKFGKCLKDRHLLFIGDSNLRSFAQIIQGNFHLTSVHGTLRGQGNTPFAINVGINMSLSFFRHYIPNHSPLLDKNIFVPTTKRLDDIPAGNNSIVVLHLWLHSKMLDTRVFRRRIRQIRISAERMLQRAPHVDLVIKGPHACTDQIPSTDYAILEHRRIWWEEFQGIHDKVIFLDMWDMTVGNENKPSHPPCVKHMVFTFLSHLCSI